MIKTKACQRCGGDLALEVDEHGRYAACIQCGAIFSAVVLEVAPTPARAARVPAARTPIFTRR